jgi:hypothetical protein
MTRIRTEAAVARTRRPVRITSLLIVVALVGGTANAQFNKSKLIPFWDASDESNAERIDHSAWQDLLSAYLRSHGSGVNRFDYAALKASPEDTAKLARYMTYLQDLDPRDYSRAEQKAYWINFYNGLTVKLVVDAHPVESIRDIRKNWLAGLVFPGPWDDVHARVAGRDVTLNNIENGILRPIWNDDRIHYGVNCASYGCPNLCESAFTAENTDALLEAGARNYVNHMRGVDFVDEDFIVVSSIYDWYAEDFGDSEEGVIEHLTRYAEGELAERIKNFEGAMDFEYDWSLNQP